MLMQQGDARHFIDEAYKHAKPIAATAEGVQLLAASAVGQIPNLLKASPQSLAEQGIVAAAAGNDVKGVAESFVAVIAKHRFWGRPQQEWVPA